MTSCSVGAIDVLGRYSVNMTCYHHNVIPDLTARWFVAVLLPSCHLPYYQTDTTISAATLLLRTLHLP